MRNVIRIIGALIMLAAITALALPLGQARSAAPKVPDNGSGTLSVQNPSIVYSAGPFLVSNPTGQAGLICNQVFPCDDFALTVIAPSPYSGTQNIRVQVGWPNTTSDFDVYILDSTGSTIASSASSSDPEVAIFPAVAGTTQYTVRVVPFAVTGDMITENITFEPIPAPPPPGSGPPPRYQNYVSPPNLGNDAGEPSIGSDWRTGATMYLAGLQALRVTFTDTCTSPSPALWEDKSYVASQVTLDPILFTDSTTGRTFVSELNARTSIMGITDNDGDTYTPSEGGSAFVSGVDHQTVGGGPFAPGVITATGTYTHSVYYCSQDIAQANCALSHDGGVTFDPAVPIYTLQQCGGIHGHVKVGPDGTAYVPNKGCGGAQAVVSSTDNGTTWTVHQVTGSTPGGTDPSLGISTDGTLYFGFQGADNHARISVSHDHGSTWSTPIDVGAQFSIQNMVFPEVVAGDPNRAAFSFIGTPTGGNYQDPTFTGVWHVYASSTFDGGVSWITVDVTPNDPVQRGSICTGGTTCGNDRNLLDFYDITVDRQGRVLIGYADGCIGGCVNAPPNSFSAKATIARQSGGRRLFAAFDPTEPGVPGAPVVSATRSTIGDVHLYWTEPDNGGSPITMYKVLRRTASSGYTQIGTTIRTNFDDITAVASTTYFYRVIAVNAVGESPPCNEIQVGPAVTPESPCALPGITALTDPTGDETDMVPGHDIQKVSFAEPYFSDGSHKVAFTLKVANLGTGNLTPLTQWNIYFTPPMTTTVYFAQMSTNGAGTPSFNYGTGTTVTGAADTGSGYSPDGTITIVLSTNKINNPVAGQRISTVYSRVIVGALAVDNANFPNPDSGVGYTLVGNAYCGPNSAPIAVLNAAPVSGNAPLLVNFDGSQSSDPDPQDTIVSYRFIFGDGQVISTTQSMVTHTYTATGTYRAQLNVVDSRGLINNNVAQTVINVTGGGGTPTATRTPGGPTSTATRTATVAPTQTPGGPTATTQPSSTRTTTALPSATSILPTITVLVPTSTRTATIAPTQTPGGPTATTQPTSTQVPSSTSTTTRTATHTATPRPPTQTPGGPTATTEPTDTAVPTSPATATTEPSVTPTVCPFQFTDVPADSTFYSYIRCLACRGVMSGYPCGGPGEPCDPNNSGYFRPGNQITRGQIAKIVSNAAGFSEDPGPQIYEDVDQSNTFYVWVNRLSNRGFMGGYACGTVPQEPCIGPNNRPYFRTSANATRGQLAKVVANAAEVTGEPTGQFYADVPESSPFYLWIMRLTNIGVISGYPCGGPGEPCDDQNRPYFRPFTNVTRGQASKIVANTFFPNCQTPVRR